MEKKEPSGEVIMLSGEVYGLAAFYLLLIVLWQRLMNESMLVLEASYHFLCASCGRCHRRLCTVGSQSASAVVKCLVLPQDLHIHTVPLRFHFWPKGAPFQKGVIPINFGSLTMLSLTAD